MKKIALTFALIILCFRLMPQSDSKAQWLSLGPLVYGAHNSSGFGLTAGWDIKSAHHFKFRLSWMEEFVIMSNLEPDRFTDAGIMYSWVAGRGSIRLTGAAGLGFLAGRKYLMIENTVPYSYRKEKIFVPAVPMELGIDFTGKHVGAGIAGFTNINAGKSVTGLLFRILFGNIR